MKKFNLSFLLVLTLSVTACTTFPIRTEKNLPNNPKDICTQDVSYQVIGGKQVTADRKTCAKHSIYKIQNSMGDDLSSRMYIIEINDQGLIANPKTAEAALVYLRDEMKTNNKPFVSLFVHGWNNNAQANNVDLISFEQAVLSLNASQQGDQKSNVAGIYVSWRGKTMPAGLSHAFTFWGRKAVSEEVGRGHLASFIFELETIVKPKPKANDMANGKLILSGHSFGASALYNAVGHELISRFYNSLRLQKDDPTQEIRGVGDIVVLLNPAIQALRFNGLRETVYYKTLEAQKDNKNIFEHNKAPIFMMVATEDDFPVETAFPIGRTISHFLSHNASGQMTVYKGIQGDTIDTSIKKAERNSIGFYQPYYTHFVLRADDIQPKPESTFYRAFNATQNATRAVLNLPKAIVDNMGSQTTNDVTDHAQTPVQEPEIIEKITEEAPSKPSSELSYALNIGDCFSEKVISEFESGQRKEIDWLSEAIGENERFSTVVKNVSNPENNMDLLKLKITNHPRSLKAGIVNQWSLLQKYEKDEVLTWSRNPYWFVKAKANVMQGHNGIWNKNVGCLLLSVMATEPVTLHFIRENEENKQQQEQDTQNNLESELSAGLKVVEPIDGVTSEVQAPVVVGSE